MSSTKQSLVQARHALVNNILVPNGIYDIRIRQAMYHIPRHLFLHPHQWAEAYENRVLPIGYRQTMLDPLLTAKILQLLHLTGAEHVLEIGTGTGYLTALLAKLAGYVYSLERIIPLAERAAKTLDYIGCQNVDLHIGDGSQGLADMAPYDVIIVSASVPKVPRPLAMQLKPNGGRMIIPIGQGSKQNLAFIQRDGYRWHKHTIAGVSLAPLIGHYGTKPPDTSSIAGN